MRGSSWWRLLRLLGNPQESVKPSCSLWLRLLSRLWLSYSTKTKARLTYVGLRLSCLRSILTLLVVLICVCFQDSPAADRIYGIRTKITRSWLKIQTRLDNFAASLTMTSNIGNGIHVRKGVSSASYWDRRQLAYLPALPVPHRSQHHRLLDPVGSTLHGR